MAASSTSPWPHRWSVAVALVIFPLIWLGGLVTTQDAGMAVPDWPTTRGYNMFAYPLSAWIYGPFDLLIEHGHRLLGSFVGLLAIGLCAVAWRCEPRRWVNGLCWILLLAIIVQGLLGGIRVIMDDRTFAMIHGFTGPLVFALATAVAVVTGRWWRLADRIPGRLPRLSRTRGGFDGSVGRATVPGRPASARPTVDKTERIRRLGSPASDLCRDRRAAGRSG